MTEKLFYKDQYIRRFKASVISCEGGGKNFEVILDKTAFYPEGGGQPGDRGFIGGAKVTDTVEKNGEIIHICAGAVSGEVECEIDWDFRFLNMQRHTGEHIFSGILHSLTGFDNVGFHMGEDAVTVDFNGSVDPSILSETEKRSNETVWANIPVETIYPADGELKNYDYRSKKEINGQVRLIRIGGADLCACCGTHTAFTGEVGVIKAVAMMNYKQGVRITLKIGAQALADYAEKNENAARISASLCAKTGETADAVEKLKEKLEKEHFALYELKNKYFALKCEGANPGLPLVFDDSGNADDARLLASCLAEKFGRGFAFSGCDADGYKYAAVSKDGDIREFGKKINAALNGRGGGKPDIVMGSVTAPKSEILRFFTAPDSD